MSRYIPMPAYPDMMPVDISFVFADEKPAGKHGFIRADGDNLRFEDGTLGKFWGVNAEGFYAGRVPTTYENGILSFEIGDELNPACYYLIVKE